MLLKYCVNNDKKGELFTRLTPSRKVTVSPIHTHDSSPESAPASVRPSATTSSSVRPVSPSFGPEGKDKQSLIDTRSPVSELETHGQKYEKFPY